VALPAGLVDDSVSRLGRFDNAAGQDDGDGAGKGGCQGEEGVGRNHLANFLIIVERFSFLNRLFFNVSDSLAMLVVDLVQQNNWEALEALYSPDCSRASSSGENYATAISVGNLLTVGTGLSAASLIMNLLKSAAGMLRWQSARSSQHWNPNRNDS
jgi:hypothetical protein